MTPSPVLSFTWLVCRQNVPESIISSHFVSNVSHADNIESSSPLFVPAKPEKKSVRRTRKHIREGGSTDSEDLVLAGTRQQTSKKKRRRGRTNQKESKSKAAANNRGEDKDSVRSTATEKSEGRPKNTQKLLKTANDVTAAAQTEQLPSNEAPKPPGECSTRLSFIGN